MRHFNAEIYYWDSVRNFVEPNKLSTSFENFMAVQYWNKK